MQRILVAFEAPSPLTEQTHEAAWDEWVSTLHYHGLELAADLDPVQVFDGIEVYEAVARG